MIHLKHLAKKYTHTPLPTSKVSKKISISVRAQPKIKFQKKKRVEEDKIKGMVNEKHSSIFEWYYITTSEEANTAPIYEPLNTLRVVE